jgi:hypothetical protein
VGLKLVFFSGYKMDSSKEKIQKLFTELIVVLKTVEGGGAVIGA